MTEPTKFVLNDKLWRNLPSQYLEDSLLCSSPQDAIKWLVVSKDIKEVIEENRDKMRLFDEKISFRLFLDNSLDNILLYAGGCRQNTVDCNKTTEAPAASSPILEFIGRNSNIRFWRLTDTSLAGMKRFIKLIVDWVTIGGVEFRWGCTNLEVLRPLAEGGVCITFCGKDEVDDALMDAIESLHIRNLNFCSLRFDSNDSLLHRLRDDSSIQWAQFDAFEKLKHLDYPFIHVVGSNNPSANFIDTVVVPWLDGERPRLKMMTFVDEAAFNCPLFEPVNFVPAASEAKNNRRVFLLMDKKENIMEVKVDFNNRFSRVTVRIASLA